MEIKRHGLSAYDRHGCRCEVCTEAKRKRGEEYRAKNRSAINQRGAERRKKFETNIPPNIEHGYHGYTYYQCRCGICKQARKDYMADYRKRKRKELLAYGKQKYREERSEQLAYHKKRREDNPGMFRARDAAQRIKHAERIKRHEKEYLQTERGKLVNRMKRHRRRMLEYGCKGHATNAQLQARWDYYGGLCYMCGKPADTFDHVIPLVLGGTGWAANFRPACRSCNSRKDGDKRRPR